ncbi:fumarylacetoacetate hydrolase [Aspergillus arachidicola]|uniref:Fumarylacetoacetate hydrolase n=1 Tax=Aspergillus arachidicola TaxID=656916 RepID=A0A2G7FTG1_9EURO|nr:fumarylacetoacetate hydrolase [Aspergillus arachidicola]
MAPTWTHLVRFISEEDGQVHLGEVDPSRYPDVGIAVLNGERIAAKLVTGSIFDGVVTNTVMHISRLLAPIGIEDVPIIRCMGLNYRDHAKEANMPIPDVPVLFMKPRTALNGPFPAMINVPKIAQDGSSDYEAELSIILSKTGRDIPESEAMSYILGYTCSNDVSARTQQFKNSQWCFSKELTLPPLDKGLDGSCPLGPVLVSPSAIGDPHNLRINAIHNGEVVQASNTREMIFDIAKIIAFLSQGTTLEKGTIIMTGTGPGIGAMRTPKVVLRDGDDIRVVVENIGTLANKVYYEQL